ncbi:hypothetical protein [Lysobacter niastensis]|uniref:Uncharacterized protein n=1 Tax=Lysobacter niastensis TaxID=380629 RepID=A0ABS0B548_9GAMM|nr:hypothetical protein [Lysobacter niastensis]MBF6023702.1 hypothetical protein [Lysobacter niastensis]
MKLMTLMAAAALLAATHAISTRVFREEEDAALAQVATRIHDLPAVRVYAEPEVKREEQPDPLQVALRVHDMPRVRVYAQAEDLGLYRPVASRGKLAVPRGSQRRGIRPIESEQQESAQQRVSLNCTLASLDASLVPDCAGGSDGREGYAVLSRGRLAGGRD